MGNYHRFARRCITDSTTSYHAERQRQSVILSDLSPSARSLAASRLHLLLRSLPTSLSDDTLDHSTHGYERLGDKLVMHETDRVTLLDDLAGKARLSLGSKRVAQMCIDIQRRHGKSLILSYSKRSSVLNAIRYTADAILALCCSFWPALGACRVAKPTTRSADTDLHAASGYSHPGLQGS